VRVIFSALRACRECGRGNANSPEEFKSPGQ
jgi:hypothetical protein